MAIKDLLIGNRMFRCVIDRLGDGRFRCSKQTLDNNGTPIEAVPIFQRICVDEVECLRFFADEDAINLLLEVGATVTVEDVDRAIPQAE
jgi:hypothetical protein